MLDEYDAPLQAAWEQGYWKELVSFMQLFLISTFKTNPYLERGLITGITSFPTDSFFSSLNNLEVVSTTSNFYTDCFGFTEEEVFAAMDEYGLTDKAEVKQWYDGFIFGRTKGIYNPWSIINYLKKKEFVAYWANTSSNKIVGDLIAQASEDVQEETSDLLTGKSINIKMDAEFVFSQLDEPGAVWSYLMASGYVKPINFNLENREYELTLTNHEVHLTLATLITDWFKKTLVYKRKFVQALLSDDVKSMNTNLNQITKTVFSYFDASGDEPERFYHCFVLGLIVDLKDRYNIKSNRESGDGRYDVVMFPKQANDHGIVIEFKTSAAANENQLAKTCKSALQQIREKEYIADLVSNNVMPNQIYVYGFAFKNKNVLICGGAYDQIDWSDIIKE